MIRKILCIVLALLVAVPVMLPSVYAQGVHMDVHDTGWGMNFDKNDRYTFFMPEDKYVSVQNPPGFRFPLVANATYEVIVCSDPELKNVVYTEKDLKSNFCSFGYPFETGVEYYWAARYTSAGKTSGWSDVRRFRIDPDAVPFVVPPMEELFAKIPTSHPRTYYTQANLEEMKSLKDTSPAAKKIYDNIISSADNYITKWEIYPEPVLDMTGNWSQTLRSSGLRGCQAAMTTGFAYMMTGDEKYAKYAIENLMETASWDIDGVTSYAQQDQLHREICYQSAIALDWVWDAATEEERAFILDMIERRLLVMEYLLTSLANCPNDSHGWTAYGYMGIACIAIYHESEIARRFMDAILPTYLALNAPWDYQDGGWSQGPHYWRESSRSTQFFIDALVLADIFDPYQAAYHRNEYLWQMYAYPSGVYASFGDGGNRKTRGDSESYAVESITNQAHFLNNGYAKWFYDNMSRTIGNTVNDYYVAPFVENVEAISPSDRQLAHEFHDIGWVLMTDDLASYDKIHMTFKSSPYGSYNHSMSDQNAFILQAFGERIATRSGYYDSYHSTFDNGITRQTAATNNVTIATNRGQGADSLAADGHLTGFLTQIDFDLASGDATQAYGGQLGMYERSIIYIRPDIFVVVDELKAKEGKKSKFEWWLHSENDIEIYDDRNGCTFRTGNAVLDTSVVYPHKLTPYYNDIHALSDMIEYQPVTTEYQSKPIQRKIWFETEKVDRTKVVAALDVHRKGTEARYVDTDYFDGYIRMTFENGTVLYVNTNEKTTTVDAGDVVFTGEAVVYNDRSIMLVHGTELTAHGKLIAKSEKEMSFVAGDNELSLSTYDDNRITFNTDNDYIQGINSVTDYDGRPIGEAYGIVLHNGALTPVEGKEGEFTIEEAENYKTFDAKMDNYSLMLNGKIISSKEELNNTVDVFVDGQLIKSVEIKGYMRRDGKTVFIGKTDIPKVKYQVEEISEDLKISALMEGDRRTIPELNMTVESTEKQYIKLKSLPVSTPEVYEEKDYNSVKESAAAFIEAESWITHNGGNVYNTRSFMSGGAGVQLLSSTGHFATYEFTIEEAGTYDLAVNAVSWDLGGSVKAFDFGGNSYVVNLFQTADWGTVPENWTATIAKTGAYLEPGTYTMTVEHVEGNWNVDWFALVKR